RVIEADQSLAFVDQRSPVALRESFEGQELEHRLPWRGADLPPTRDEAVDEERRPDLGREDHLLLVFRREDPRPFCRIVAEDRRVRLRRFAKLRGRRHEPRQLTVLPARAALLPDDPARGDRREEVPVAEALVLRRVTRDELTDLVARARRRRELEDPVVDVLERGEIRSSRRPPRGEASIKGRERVRRVLLRADEVKSRAHERRLDDQPLVDRYRE